MATAISGSLGAACASQPTAPSATPTPAQTKAVVPVAPTPVPPTAPAALKAPKKLTFMAGFKAQANVSFVGVYVAQEVGMFRDQQLEVEIKHSAGQGEHAKLLAAKQVHVITETASSLVKNVTGEGIPFISLAVLTQRGDGALVSLKSSGIDEPKKFEGKIVGYKAIPTFEYIAMLKAARVDRSKVREVSVGFDVRVLTEGKVDVLPVFKSNEPDILRRLGFELNIFDPADYGVPSMGQIWSTHRELLAADPDLFERFVKAALNGLSYALKNPGEAIDHVMKYAPREDRSHQEYMLAAEKESALTDQTRKLGLGWQTVEQWAELQDGLAEFGLIKNQVEPQLFFADAIQRKIYRDGKLVWP
ncbi:MAG: ABC transporter substrate-binding protein [Chloroflexi bacterium]|nr:ABC transporter substrate-binding protein [Chloroflexota bacterium]